MELTTLINAYRGPLIGLLASWGAPWGEAVDLAEESLAEAWLNRESCRGDWRQIDVFGRWLRGVARNRYRNWTRSRWRRRAHIDTGPSAALELLATSPAPEMSEHLEALREAIERLPAPQRQVVLMHYLEETSVSEVATLLGVSVKTVEGRLYQARKTLRRLLESKPAAAQIGRMLLCL